MCHSDLHKCLEVPKPCSWTPAHPRVSFWASVSWANHLFCCIMHANLLADGLMGWQGSIFGSLHITFIIMCMYYYKNRHMCVQFTCLPCIMFQSTSPLCLSWLFSHFLHCSPLVFNPRASSVGFSLRLCQYASTVYVPVVRVMHQTSFLERQMTMSSIFNCYLMTRLTVDCLWSLPKKDGKCAVNKCLFWCPHLCAFQLTPRVSICVWLYVGLRYLIQSVPI